MPIPKPNAEEQRESFIDRFMGNEEMINEYPYQEQRLAVAFRQWNQRNKNLFDNMADDIIPWKYNLEEAVTRNITASKDYIRLSKIDDDKTKDYLGYIKEHKLNMVKAYRIYQDNTIFKNYKKEIMERVVLHDMSKYSPQEFEAYRSRFFPREGEKYDEDAFNKAWEHHYNNNPHHYNSCNTEYMGLVDILEMILDWEAMGLKFGNTAKEFYQREAKEKLKRFKVDTELIEEILEAQEEKALHVIHTDKHPLSDYLEGDSNEVLIADKPGENIFESKGKYDSINFKPPQSLADAAKRGLEMREKQPKSNRGGTAVGLARARQLVNRENLSPDTIKRMFSFFSRHEVNKQSESWKKGNSKAEQAWLLWGGDAGFAWVKKIIKQMDKEENKKGSDTMTIEKKSLDLTILEVKQDGDKGFFKAYLNTYHNIDHGDDITMPSFGEMNEGRVIPLLKQHEAGTDHGMLTVHHDNKGMLIDGELYLEMVDGTQTPVFDEAWKTYAKLLRGKKGGIPVKFSMGYKVTDKEYDNVDGHRVRRLIKGYVMEGSVVTFPMNENSLQTAEVKQNNQGGKSMRKRMNMEQMMAMEDAEEKLYKMNRMFSKAMMDTMMDPEMDMTAKMTNINEIMGWMMANYPKACEAYMKGYHMDDGMMMKDVEMNFDTKSMTFTIEQKAGAKVSKATMDRMRKAMDLMKKAEDMIKECMGMAMNEDGKSDADLLETKENDNLELEQKLLDIANIFDTDKKEEE